MSNLPTVSQQTPALFEGQSIIINEPPELNHTHTPEQVKKNNVEMYNQKLKIHHALWAEAKTFNRCLTMLREMDRLMAQRAEVMGYTYGAAQNKVTSGGQVLPLD